MNHFCSATIQFYISLIFICLMKLGILWSGGKDSAYTSFLAKKYGYELACLISIIPKNQDSFMFHPSSAEQIKKQAKVMSIPLVLKRTIGKKEIELIDLKEAIKEAKAHKRKIHNSMNNSVKHYIDIDLFIVTVIIYIYIYMIATRIKDILNLSITCNFLWSFIDFTSNFQRV